MAFRNVYVSKKSHIHVKNSNLAISQELGTVEIPTEDILSLVVEDRSSTLSAYAMSYMAQKDIAVYFCDAKHLPNSVHLPFASHIRKLRKSEVQWQASIPLQKNLWRQIVKRKIYNQAKALSLIGNKDVSEKLSTISQEVLSGDSTNREGYAAQLYFKSLFGKDFSRQTDNLINSCLNYGYAIVRGVIARSISAYGFNPEKGIMHKNEFNNFNLADDFIEPYRPLLDLYVKSKFLKNNILFDTVIKAKLYDVLNYKVKVGTKLFSLVTSVDQVIQGYARSIEMRDHKHLVLPELVALERTQYE